MDSRQGVTVAEKPEPAKPTKPQGLQELDLDDKQQFEMGFRQLGLFLKDYAAFSEWLARNGRT